LLHSTPVLGPKVKGGGGKGGGVLFQKGWKRLVGLSNPGADKVLSPPFGVGGRGIWGLWGGEEFGGTVLCSKGYEKNRGIEKGPGKLYVLYYQIPQPWNGGGGFN